MSSEQKIALRRIRTFAQDVATAQGKNGTSATTVDTLVPPAVSLPTEKVAAIKAFDTQTPTKEVVEVKESKPSIQTERMPAFHELQKKATVPEVKVSATHTAPTIPTIKVEPAKKITVRSKKPNLKEKMTVPGGTIITDTKRNKTNFFDAFIASINTWFTNLNKKLTEKKVPTYTVTDVERRKGVVQKATSKTGTIFTADRETLKEEIRKRNQVPTPPPHETEVSWSPRTEPGFALLESHKEPEPIPARTPERVFVEFRKKSLPEPAIILPSIPEPIIIPEAAPLVEVSTPVPEAIHGYEALEMAEAKRPVIAQTPPPATVIAPPTPMDVPEEIPKESITKSSTKDQRSIFVGILNTFRFNTNALTFSIAGSVITILIMVLVARTVVTFILPNKATTSQTPAAKALLASTTVTDLSLPTLSQEVLIDKLKTIEKISGSAQEIRLTNSDDIPLSATTALQLLGFAGSKTLVQNVSEVHVVTINAQRAILLKTTDPTAAFGSILKWEPTMATDLQTFMGLVDPSQTNAFSDNTIGSTDVRILATDGKEQLVYGFIGATTILITEDTISFTNIVGSR